MIRRAAVLLLLVAAGCASSSSKHPEPEVALEQTSAVPEAARNITGSIPVRFRVTIHNTTATALQLHHMDLVTQGEGAYALQPPISRSFDESIAVGDTKSYDVWGSAFIDSPAVEGANGAVTIRLIIQFDSPTGAFQSVSVQRVHWGAVD